MKALKLRNLVLPLLLALSFNLAASGQAQSESHDSQDANASGQENAESNDQGGDRGFDPCLLNPSLAVCANQQ